MPRHLMTALALAATVAVATCLEVPPEQLPPESSRKATAMVDHNGKLVEGGNLIINIPPAAIPQGERVQVTIDVIVGVPPRHLSEAYLVGPDGYTFQKPVSLTYQYKESHVAEVVNSGLLFLGVAQGNGWLPLEEHQHDFAARRVTGISNHFSVFGLIDPDMAVDGGAVIDAARTDSARPDAGGWDLRRDDAAGVDTGGGLDAGVTPSELHIQLTWTGATADLDLHLLRIAGGQFTNDDCYYANCKGTSPDWPPTGPDGDPHMDVDDVSGYGPENTNVAIPADGSYIVAVHGYSMHSDPVPMDFTVTVYHGGDLLLSTARQLVTCGDFMQVADIDVTGGGLSASASVRTETPWQEQASCL